MSARDSILRLAAELLAGSGGDPARVIVTIRDGQGTTLRLEGAPPAPAAAPRLTAYERAVYAACTHAPQTRKRLAAAAGKRCDTHLHAAVRELLAQGLVEEDHRGVRLATSDRQ